MPKRYIETDVRELEEKEGLYRIDYSEYREEQGGFVAIDEKDTTLTYHFDPDAYDFYKEHGERRWIFPGKLSLNDIIKLAKK